jgi:site-specific recombinase XerD
VEAYLQRCALAPSTLETYHKGLRKLGEYLRLRLNKPAPEKKPNWEYHLAGLPDWIAQDLHAYLAHSRRRWLPERKREAGDELLSRVTSPLRWMAAHFPLEHPADLTPAVWTAYLDARLEQGISPVTLNGTLSDLLNFVHFLEEQGEVVCERLYRVEFLKEGPRLPKDAAPLQLRQVYAEIEKDAASSHGYTHRLGLLDRAWYLLMLHSGLRTGEVRRLKLSEIDVERRQVRIEQSKGLKDRIVFLTTAAIQAIQEYLAVRGPEEALPKNLFIFRHAPLSRSYCYERLQHYGERCGVLLTPHQLRFSCATLLINAGAPAVSVQAILGHKWIDTTLGYARLYDGTLAADYYRAMNEVERQLELVERPPQDAPGLGELVALLDSLRSGTLNDQQATTVQAIRDGIMAMAREETILGC